MKLNITKFISIYIFTQFLPSFNYFEPTSESYIARACNKINAKTPSISCLKYCSEIDIPFGV